MRLRRVIKFAISFVIVLLILIIIGLIFSHSIEEKIIKILSEKASKYLVSEIHIRKNDIHFSIFKKFPTASLELNNVCVKVPPQLNIDEVQPIKHDTLLFAKQLYLQMNLISLLKKHYDLEKISVYDGFLQLITDKKGNSSLDILRKVESTNDSEFSAKLESFSVNNLKVYTVDYTSKTKITLQLNKGAASGSFSNEEFSMRIKSIGKIEKYEAKSQIMEPNQHYFVDAEIDFRNSTFIIQKGLVNISNIPLKVVGTIKTEKYTTINLSFAAAHVPIKQIDKAVLHGLLGNNGLEPKNGTLNVTATIKGNTHYSLPAIKAVFKIENGKIYDNRRDFLFEDIFLKGNVDNGELHLPKTTTIRIDTFNVKSGNSRQSGRLKIQNLIEPRLLLSLNGTLDIEELNKFYHNSSIELLQGKIHNTIAITGIIDKKNSKNDQILKGIEYWGNLNFENLEVRWVKYDMPNTVLSGRVELHDAHQLILHKVRTKSGNTDLTVDGTLANFQTPTRAPAFYGSVHSDYFLTDDFVDRPSQKNKEMQPIVFPDSVDFKGHISINNYVFRQFTSKNVSGEAYYHNRTLKVNNFSMDGYEGNMKGEIILRQKESGNIVLINDAVLTDVNIQKLFVGCRNFGQDVITSEFLGGKLYGQINFSSEWTNKLYFVPESALAQSNIEIRQGELKNYEPLMGLSNFIRVEELKHIQFDNLKTSISIHDQQVFLDQTKIVSSAISFEGSGVHGFDNNYEYRLQVGMSDLLWKKARKKKADITEFGYIVDDGIPKTVVPFIISGKGTTFDVKYDKRTARNGFKQKLENEKNVLKGLLNKESEQAEKEVESIRVEDINNVQEPPAGLHKTDSGKYRSTSKDFILEWDDSE